MAASIMSWMKPLDSNGKKVVLGQGEVLLWEEGVDKKDMVIAEKMGLLKGISSNFVSPSMFVDWSSLAGMHSLGNGNPKGLKAEGGVSKWQQFLRIFIEWAFRVTNTDPDEKLRNNDEVSLSLLKKKKTVQKKSNIVKKVVVGIDVRDSDEDFVSPKKKTFVKPKPKENLEKRIVGEEYRKKIKEETKKRMSTSKKNKRNEGGVDDNLHLGIALSVSEAIQNEKQREAKLEKVRKLEKRKNAAETKEITDRLVAFMQSDKDQFNFKPCLSSYERRIVHQVGESLGLESASVGEGNKRRVTVKKRDLIDEEWNVDDSAPCRLTTSRPSLNTSYSSNVTTAGGGTSSVFGGTTCISLSRPSNFPMAIWLDKHLSSLAHMFYFSPKQSSR